MMWAIGIAALAWLATAFFFVGVLHGREMRHRNKQAARLRDGDA